MKILQLTTNQLIEKLSEQGVYAHRNTIPSDIESSETQADDILSCDKSTQNKYFMGSRHGAEIKCYSDAVNAAQFISKKILPADRQARFPGATIKRKK